MNTSELLSMFGLTGQEARIYESMHEYDQATGYELSKSTGISRSNTYAALNSLTNKGCARLIDGRPLRYQAVPVQEFCSSVIRNLKIAQKSLEELLQPVSMEDTPYLTIKGSKNIANKISFMLVKAEERAYITMSSEHLNTFIEPLRDLIKRKCKVVIITDRIIDIPGAIIYLDELDQKTVRVITDSLVALTGEMSSDAESSCLYSKKPDLVNLLKDSIRNEISLIGLKTNNKNLTTTYR